jgi:hypothetical protein
VGDALTTNYTLFQYTLAYITKANAGDSGVSYTGATLEHCDVTSIYLTGDLNSWAIDYTALVTCRTDDYEFAARADFTVSKLAGKYTPLLGVQIAYLNRLQAGKINNTADASGVVLDEVIFAANTDILDRALDLVNNSNKTTSAPRIVSILVDYPVFCPAAFGRDAACAIDVPPVNITFTSTVFTNGTLRDRSGPPDDTLVHVLSNVIQSVHAALRLDLGNPSPNNFLLNTSVIPATLFASFPGLAPGLTNNRSRLYAALTGNPLEQSHNITELLPLSAPGPAVQDIVYLCRFQRAKSPSKGFIAVLVATLSMFSSGWALYVAVAESVVKMRDREGGSLIL